jgi:hypothetical protein
VSNGVVIKGGALVAGPITRHLVITGAAQLLRKILKDFDEASDVPAEVKSLTEKNFKAGQELLVRIKEAEAHVRSAEKSNKDEDIRNAINIKERWLDQAIFNFVQAAGVLSGIKRVWALYYLAVCLGKLGHEQAAIAELARAKPELIRIKKELEKKAPRSPGFGIICIAVCVGIGAYWFSRAWLAPIIVTTLAWLISVLVATSVSPKDVDDLVEVCELGKKIEPDDPAAFWAVPPWALKNTTKTRRIV